MSTAVAQFSSTLSWDGTIGDDTLRLEGTFGFARFEGVDEVGALHLGREFGTDSVVVVDHAGDRYWLTGATGRIDSARDRPDRFIRILDGVLVGSGALNNALLDVSVRFTECEDGTALAEVLGVRISNHEAS